MAKSLKRHAEEEYTVVLIKPDGVRRKIVGEVVSRFEKVGLRLAAAKLIWVNRTHVGKHYKNDTHYLKSVGEKALENYSKYGFDTKESFGTKDALEIGKKVRDWNMEFLTSGPVFAILLAGPDAVKIVKKIAGYTFSPDAGPGTIRGDLGADTIFKSNFEGRAAENIIHVSTNKKEAAFEKKLWFKRNEIYKY